MKPIETFLQEGDVILIKKGMKVYANLPIKFFAFNEPINDNITNKYIEIGTKLESQPITKSDILECVNKIDKIISYLSNKNLNNKITDFLLSIIDEKQSEIFDTSNLEGEYIVYRTCYDGGSTGRDEYPNGHHVYCENINNSNFKIDFYQSGCFSAVILPCNIQPIRKLTKKWE